MTTLDDSCVHISKIIKLKLQKKFSNSLILYFWMIYKNNPNISNTLWDMIVFLFFSKSSETHVNLRTEVRGVSGVVSLYFHLFLLRHLECLANMKIVLNDCFSPGLSIPRPSTAMNAARHKIINFLKTLRFLCYCKDIWYKLTWYFFYLFIFFLIYEEIGKSPQNFSKNKRQIFEFWMRKNISKFPKSKSKFWHILNHFYRLLL